jgi:hypothetical protein
MRQSGQAAISGIENRIFLEQPGYSPANPNAKPRFRIERILFPLVFALVVLTMRRRLNAARTAVSDAD